MSDLIERLRGIVCYGAQGDIDDQAVGAIDQAASEIERLTAENEKLRGALAKIALGFDFGGPDAECKMSAFASDALDDHIDLPRLTMGEG